MEKKVTSLTPFATEEEKPLQKREARMKIFIRTTEHYQNTERRFISAIPKL
jgi:hypothetical protein